ncbi:unnamed protein product [Spirodela intermedia]|uniref:Uncharacterized protein n=1 Tax=Spirodela intermedia TaxID=51605 RepID=A0A7I8IMF5_SPIIN|nr:unnamed protein product [Spirodela intermedia]CAA6659048.1 unnamed protein product [Spirodela intermedia]
MGVTNALEDIDGVLADAGRDLARVTLTLNLKWGSLRSLMRMQRQRGFVLTTWFSPEQQSGGGALEVPST